MKKYLWKSYKLIYPLLILFVLAGCTRAPQRPNVESEENKSPKLPKILTELDDEVLKIMYDLDSVTAIEKAIQKQEALKTQSSTSTKSENSEASVETVAQSNESGGQGGQEGQEGESKNEVEETEEKVNVQDLIKETKIIIPLLDANEVKGSFTESSTPPADIDKVWNTINDSVTEIHKKWNVLEAQLTPVNVPREKLEEFEQILDQLTLSAMNREKLDSLKLSNELTRVTTDFRSYFDGAGEHALYGMYYHIRGVILFAASNSYQGAIEHLDETSRLGANIRNDLIKQDAQNILQKFELSIEDLRKQLQSQNFTLSQIKAPIVIKNIKLIEEQLKTSK